MKPTSWVGETYASQGLTEFPEVAQEQPGIFKRLAAAGEAASQFFFLNGKVMKKWCGPGLLWFK